MAEISSISLSALNQRIQAATEDAFPFPIWVVAEILELNVNRSGHCYLELIEKSERDNSIVAKSRGTIWSSMYNMVRSYFETVTKTKLEPGLKVLLKASVTFHGIYGLSLNITDIDPNFTLGELAVKKMEIIAKLSAAGAIEMNKELTLSMVPQRIAIISSETAAGYGDFIDSLLNNKFNFSFSLNLFPAIVQGDAAEASIINALENIYDTGDHFDVVVLIRGGGSQADLECFNSFDLAMNIAQFPLPVLTGIGHERDETIADIVAFQSLKTPTAVAEFLIDRVSDFAERLTGLQDKFERALRWIIQEESNVLQLKVSELNKLVSLYIAREQHVLGNFSVQLRQQVQTILKNRNTFLASSKNTLKYLWRASLEQHKRNIQALEEKQLRTTLMHLKVNKEALKSLEKSLGLLRPERVLARGYSITYYNGKSLKSTKKLTAGSKITTLLAEGSMESTIEKITKSNEQK